MSDTPEEELVPTTTTLQISNSPNGRQYNQYTRLNDHSVQGRHGEVRQFETPEGQLVAMKVVRRRNNDDKWRQLQASQQARSSQLRYETMELRVQREIAFLKAVQHGRHPNMPQLIEVIDDRRYDKLYIVMEYLPGGPIPFSEHSTEPVLSVAQTRRVIRDVTLGLEYLHYYGIVHCDIKPANLLLGADNIVKIVDFSVSQVLTSEMYQCRRSGAMRVLNDPGLFPQCKELTPNSGTLSFQAPEIFWCRDEEVNPTSSKGTAYTQDSSVLSLDCDLPFSDSLPRRKPVITSSVDIWAMGVTMYCCLFGQLPFTVQGNSHLLRKIIRSREWRPQAEMGTDKIPTGGRYPKDQSTDGFLAMQLLDGMLQKDPVKRLKLQDIKENRWLLEDIQKPKRWLAQSSVGPPSPASSWSKVGKGLLSLAKGIPRRATISTPVRT